MANTMPQKMADPVYESAATGTRFWQTGPNSFKAVGRPAPAAPADKLAELSDETGYWDEPAQPSYNPRFKESMDSAMQEIAFEFSRMPKASLRDTRAVIDRIAGKYAYDMPELGPAIRSAVKDKLPGMASTELASKKANLTLWQQQQAKSQMQKELEKSHPGYYENLSTGEWKPIPETPEARRREAMDTEKSKQELVIDREKDEALKAKARSPYIAIYNKGSLGEPKFVAVDTSTMEGQAMVMENKWGAPVIPADRDFKADESVKKYNTSLKAKVFGEKPMPTSSGSPAPAAAPAPSVNVAPAPGKIYRNPRTGERITLVNGKWEQVK